MGNFVQKLGVRDQFAPIDGWVDVDFNHARIGGDLQHGQAGVARWRVAFQHDGDTELLGCGFNRSQKA